MVGFPEFWEKAHDLYPAAFKAIHELLPLQEEIFQKPVTEPLHIVMRHIAKIGMNSLGAVTTLVLNGCGNDAMGIARRMFEGAVTVAYLKDHPEKINDYIDFQYVRMKRQLDYLDEYDPEQVKALSADYRAQIESGFNRVAARFQNEKGKLLGSWSRRNIRQMTKDAGLEQLYLTFYEWASSMQHANIGGLASQTSGNDVDVAPSLEWLKIALLSAHDAALRLIHLYNQAAGHGMDEEIDKAIGAFNEAWKC